MIRRFLQLILVAVGAGAGSAAAAPLRVAATTTLVGDVARVVAGPDAAVHVLLPIGADPHAWEPRPADLARLGGSDIVFINGFDLEVFLRRLLENAGLRGRIVSVSEGMQPRLFGGADAEHEAAEAAHAEEADHHGHDHGAADPHVWFDPMRVAQWADRIARELGARDAVHAAAYAARAAAYRKELEALDVWIKEQVARLPVERRRLVCDHESFGYFADRYGFRQEGALLPGVSTLAQPSARDLAQLEKTVKEHRIPAIFTGSILSPALAERVAHDTGAKVVSLYNCSLGEPGGPAADYPAFMRFNVKAIVEALQ